MHRVLMLQSLMIFIIQNVPGLWSSLFCTRSLLGRPDSLLSVWGFRPNYGDLDLIMNNGHVYDVTIAEV